MRASQGKNAHIPALILRSYIAATDFAIVSSIDS